MTKNSPISAKVSLWKGRTGKSAFLQKFFFSAWLAWDNSLYPFLYSLPSPECSVQLQLQVSSQEHGITGSANCPEIKFTCDAPVCNASLLFLPPPSSRITGVTMHPEDFLISFASWLAQGVPLMGYVANLKSKGCASTPGVEPGTFRSAEGDSTAAPLSRGLILYDILQQT